MTFPPPLLGITNRIGFMARAGTSLTVNDLSQLAVATRLAAFDKGLSDLQTSGDLAQLLKKNASWF